MKNSGAGYVRNSEMSWREIMGVTKDGKLIQTHYRRETNKKGKLSPPRNGI